MDDQLPRPVRDVLASFLTCEVATVGPDGTAGAWPMVPLWVPDDGRIVLSTSIGFPAKAAHLRRDPRIALLFSDPTGSAATDPPTVLVQGRATVSDGPLTVSDDLLAHWRRVHALQPVSRFFSASPPARWFMDWYYVRLVVDVRPERVSWWDDPTASPQVVDVAPDPGGEPPGPTGTPAAADDPRGPERLTRRLAGFDTAVLSGRDAGGRPVALRGTPRVDGDRVLWPDTPGTGLVPGPASLLCHAHDEQLWNLRSFQARGRLDRAGDGWEFRAHRVVDGTGMAGPPGDLAAFVAARRRAGRWLERRGLPRPTVPWSQLRPVR